MTSAAGHHVVSLKPGDSWRIPPVIHEDGASTLTSPPEDSPMPRIQRVTDQRVYHSSHVWKPIGEEGWKCVLCGGITKCPTDNDECPKYEPLTNDERNLCPPAIVETVPTELPDEQGKSQRKGKK